MKGREIMDFDYMVEIGTAFLAFAFLLFCAFLIFSTTWHMQQMMYEKIDWAREESGSREEDAAAALTEEGSASEEDSSFWSYHIPREGEKKRELIDWSGFSKKAGEALEGVSSLDFGLISAAIFFVTSVLLLMAGTLFNKVPFAGAIRFIRAVSMTVFFSSPVPAAMERMGSLQAAGAVTKLAFAASILCAAGLFFLAAVCTLTALTAYEYDMPGAIRLLSSKLNRYAAEGMAGFILYAAGYLMQNRYMLSGGLAVIVLWIWLDTCRALTYEPSKKSAPSAGKARPKKDAGVYSLVPLYAREDLSFGYRRRGEGVFFQDVETEEELKERFRELAKLYHSDGKGHNTKAGRAAFTQITKEYHAAIKRLEGRR